MSGKLVRAAIAALLLALVIAWNVQSTATPLPGRQPTPAIMVEEYGTTGS